LFATESEPSFFFCWTTDAMCITSPVQHYSLQRQLHYSTTLTKWTPRGLNASPTHAAAPSIFFSVYPVALLAAPQQARAAPTVTTEGEGLPDPPILLLQLTFRLDVAGVGSPSTPARGRKKLSPVGRDGYREISSQLGTGMWDFFPEQ
jgi:hypothetical protein